MPATLILTRKEEPSLRKEQADFSYTFRRGSQAFVFLFFLEHTSKHFARWTHGQFFSEFDFADCLVRGNFLVDEAYQLRLSGVCAFFQHNEGFRNLASNAVWFSNDSAQFHAWLLIKHVFYLAWVHAVVLVFDEVFFSVGDVEVAVFVHACDVTRVKPPVTENIGGFFSVSPVTLHHLRSPNG